MSPYRALHTPRRRSSRGTRQGVPAKFLSLPARSEQGARSLPYPFGQQPFSRGSSFPFSPYFPRRNRSFRKVLLRIAGMHAMTCRQNLLWNRKVSISSPPHCRTYDSQHASGRISVLHPSRFPRDAYSWSCTAENTARFRRAENTRTHLTSGRRTVRFRHGVENGLLPFRPPFGGNHMHQYCAVSAHAADLRLFRQGSAPFYRAAYVNR